MNISILTNLKIKIPIDIVNNDLSCYHNPKKLSQILADITKELSYFIDIETILNPIRDDSEIISLYIEISGLLREMACPYSVLMEGPLESRYSSDESLTLLLRFLVSELCAVKIIFKNDPESSCLKQSTNEHNESQLNLQTIMDPTLKVLDLGSFTDIKSLFNQIELTTKEKFSKLPKQFLGKSLISSQRKLTDAQWNAVETMINHLNSDYGFRRQTLIQRLDVCIQSFMWCPKATVMAQKEKIITKYQPLRNRIQERANVTLVDLLAARDYPLTLIHVTSSGEARERSACALNKHKIGPVPDRGGRTGDMEAPPPEMPAFQKRDSNSAPSSGQQHNHRGGGLGGRGRGDGGGHNHYNHQQPSHGGGRGGGYGEGGSFHDGFGGGGYSDRGHHGNNQYYHQQQHDNRSMNQERLSQNVAANNYGNQFGSDLSYVPVYQDDNGYGVGSGHRYGNDNQSYGGHNNPKFSRGGGRGGGRGGRCNRRY